MHLLQQEGRVANAEFLWCVQHVYLLNKYMKESFPDKRREYWTFPFKDSGLSIMSSTEVFNLKIVTLDPFVAILV